MEKILEKSGNFVSLEKWEPWTKNLINLDLIEVIQFCLKIYDL